MSLFSHLLNELRKVTEVVDGDTRKRSEVSSRRTSGEESVQGSQMSRPSSWMPRKKSGSSRTSNPEYDPMLDAETVQDPDQDQDRLDDSELMRDDASDTTHATNVRGKVMHSAKAARGAATNVFKSTKITRLKFPSSRNMPRSRKTSFIGRATSRVKLDAVLSEDTEAVIYDSMNQMWQQDVFDLPVCKDLPRLVRRVVVLDHTDEILYMAPGSSKLESTHLAMKPAVEASSGSLDDEGDRLDDSEVSDQTTQPTEGVSVDDNPIENKRNSRLARWSARRKKDGRSSIKADQLSSNIAIIRMIVDLIAVLLEFLEPDEDERLAVMGEVHEIQDSVVEGSDLQLVVRQIIVAVGVDSKVTKVLKCIHQNVVLQSTVAIKEKLTMEFPTKDVRNADGWRIAITLSKGFAQVRHTRREQSIDMFGNTENHWEFEWELRMTFDQQMQNMTAAQLRVTRLILSEDMDPGLVERLKATLVDGLIVM